MKKIIIGAAMLCAIASCSKQDYKLTNANTFANAEVVLSVRLGDKTFHTVNVNVKDSRLDSIEFNLLSYNNGMWDNVVKYLPVQQGEYKVSLEFDYVPRTQWYTVVMIADGKRYATGRNIEIKY